MVNRWLIFEAVCLIYGAGRARNCVRFSARTRDCVFFTGCRPAPRINVYRGAHFPEWIARFLKFATRSHLVPRLRNDVHRWPRGVQRGDFTFTVTFIFTCTVPVLWTEWWVSGSRTDAFYVAPYRLLLLCHQLWTAISAFLIDSLSGLIIHFTMT